MCVWKHVFAASEILSYEIYLNSEFQNFISRNDQVVCQRKKEEEKPLSHGYDDVSTCIIR